MVIRVFDEVTAAAVASRLVIGILGYNSNFFLQFAYVLAVMNSNARTPLLTVNFKRSRQLAYQHAVAFQLCPCCLSNSLSPSSPIQGQVECCCYCGGFCCCSNDAFSKAFTDASLSKCKILLLPSVVDSLKILFQVETWPFSYCCDRKCDEDCCVKEK